VVGPFGMFEAFVRRAGRRWLAAKQMSRCPRPQADALFPKLDLRARNRPRIGPQLDCQLEEGLTDLGRVAHSDIGDVWLVCEGSLYGSLAFGRQCLKSFCQGSRIQRRSYFAVAFHDSHSLYRSQVRLAIYFAAFLVPATPMPDFDMLPVLARAEEGQILGRRHN